MTKKEKVLALREILDTIYPDVKCTLNYKNPLEMLIATQLSAQCTDCLLYTSGACPAGA